MLLLWMLFGALFYQDQVVTELGADRPLHHPDGRLRIEDDGVEGLRHGPGFELPEVSALRGRRAIAVPGGDLSEAVGVVPDLGLEGSQPGGSIRSLDQNVRGGRRLEAAAAAAFAGTTEDLL